MLRKKFFSIFNEKDIAIILTITKRIPNKIYFKLDSNSFEISILIYCLKVMIVL